MFVSRLQIAPNPGGLINGAEQDTCRGGSTTSTHDNVELKYARTLTKINTINDNSPSDEMPNESILECN